VFQWSQPAPQRCHVDDVRELTQQQGAPGRSLGILLPILANLGYVDDLSPEDDLAQAVTPALALDHY